MVRVRKGGRPRQDGGREPNGRLLRYPSGDLKPQLDEGTPELTARKAIIARDASMEITPLGILAGRRLITIEQYRAAARFRALYLGMFRSKPVVSSDMLPTGIGNRFLMAAPQSPLPLMAKLPSGPGPWDADDAADRQDRAAKSWEARRDRYNAIHDGLTLDQWSIVRGIVVHDEFAAGDTAVFSNILSHNVTGPDMLYQSGTKAPAAVRRCIEAISNALDRLNGPQQRRWSGLSDAQRAAMMAAEPALPPPSFR
ncbi:MAG: hypothetical protein ACRYF2_10530 [Janthinobacterium lividum]